MCLTYTVHPMQDWGMKLEQFMQMAGLNDEQMAEKIGKDRTLVSRYRRGEVIPPLEIIARIEDATSNAVTFRDFLQDRGAAQ